MWKRIDDSNLRNIGGDKHFLKRVYGWNGNKWPRLTLSIYRHFSGGYTISANRKERGSRWESIGIPNELFCDGAEMLVEAKEMLK